MTERKPTDVPAGNWVDQLIRAAQERGEFDDLPGAGKPLPGIDAPLDEDWWVRQKIRDEGLPADALLPPALLLRKEVAGLPEAVRDLPTEEAVREAVREVNLRVAAWIRTPTGPVVPVSPADPEKVVTAWRTAQGGPAASGAEAPEPPEPPEPEPTPDGEEPFARRSWSRRLLRGV
ncbi:DUF1992 domain-containing protein [Georgenia sp. SUBG003]|uniref:DnaJ family domain-containing protein n=1 Tax=Georgenia sp. SUBG003 TaxID=1497974 RepID=UPI0004D62E51|nr:hypothetical protein DA06_10950 [Georgenia sp. SUBG003]